MGGYKRIPREIKDEVLAQIKEGQKVAQLASEYGISTKTIYNWLSAGVHVEPNSGKLTCELTLPFKRLSELAQMTNSSKAIVEVPDIDEKFELAEQLDNTAQMQAFWHDYPELRRRRDSRLRSLPFASHALGLSRIIFYSVCSIPSRTL